MSLLDSKWVRLENRGSWGGNHYTLPDGSDPMPVDGFETRVKWPDVTTSTEVFRRVVHYTDTFEQGCGRREVRTERWYLEVEHSGVTVEVPITSVEVLASQWLS
ncbi:MAG: hypothetical protein V3W44_09505 [Dehalococcoidales bacterium]